MKAVKDIEALKENWLKDPIWDIEKTEGFEDHTEELLAFRKEQEAKWEAQREEQEKQTFEYRAKGIREALKMDPIDVSSNPDFANIVIMKQQVLATLLLAEQLKYLNDTFDGIISNEGLIVSATTENKYYL